MQLQLCGCIKRHIFVSTGKAKFNLKSFPQIEVTITTPSLQTKMSESVTMNEQLVTVFFRFSMCNLLSN